MVFEAAAFWISGRPGRRWPFAGSCALAALMALALTGCGSGTTTVVDTDSAAVRYVRLALALERTRSGEVTFWSGSTAYDQRDSGPPADLRELHRTARRLSEDLARGGTGADEARRARLRRLTGRLEEVIDLIAGSGKADFYSEADRIYAMRPPSAADTRRWRAARAELDALLPGSGTLARRVNAYRSRFVVPMHLRETLFAKALAECRARTEAHWSLPPGERLTVVWTESVPAAWHQYEGDFRSTLRINPQAVVLPGQALDLACHEGYPGHHAQSLLADASAGIDGLKIEDRVSVLRSRESAILEGAAEAGVGLAFPTADRLSILRDVLFPLAGLDPSEADRYVQVEALERALAGAAVPHLARYYDGYLDRQRTAEALTRDALISSPGALMDFTDRYGAYVTGYTSASDRVAAVLKTACGRPWAALRAIAENPERAVLLSDTNTRGFNGGRRGKEG